MGTKPGVAAQQRRLEALRHSIEQRHGLLTADELKQLMGLGEDDIQAYGLLALNCDGVPRYPGFQFSGGTTRARWRDLTQPLLEAGWTPEDILLWFAAPTGWLDGRAPAEALDTFPEEVRAAVTQAALGPAS